MNHANDPNGSAQTNITFGSADDTALNAATQRETPSTFVDAVVRVHSSDFDGNGVVNGLDLLIWQRNYHIASGATLGQGDATYDSAVDGDDVNAWRNQYGDSFSLGANVHIATVPEPTSLLLSLMLLALLLAGTKR